MTAHTQRPRTRKPKTCDRCKYYIPPTPRYLGDKNNEWTCALMGDSNTDRNGVDSCAGWDYEGYRAGVYVGPKFGCIHWLEAQ